MSLLVGDDGAPLSKRHGASSLRELREQGFLPAAILNHLLRLGHALIEEHWYEPDAMAQAFEIGRLGRAPARFDLDQLDHWQREAIHHAGADTLAVWGGLDELAVVPSAQRAAFLEAVRAEHLASGGSYVPRVIFTSSIAVFGAPYPDKIDDNGEDKKL